jgi:hypothetical protein
MRRESPVGRAGLVVALAGALLACCGCSAGSRTYPVRGKVLYMGQPAVGAKVVFHPKYNSDPQAIRPTGTVAQDGSFTLTSRRQNDGAPAGDYAVTVIWPAGSAKGRGAGQQPLLQDRLRGAYSNPDNPLLQAQVAEGDNELPAFELR